jgi:hypothetical protein
VAEQTEYERYFVTTDIKTDAVLEAVAVEWTGDQHETYNMCDVDRYLDDNVTGTDAEKLDRMRVLFIKAVELLGMMNEQWHDTYAVPCISDATRGTITEAERIERGLRVEVYG